MSGFFYYLFTFADSAASIAIGVCLWCRSGGDHHRSAGATPAYPH